MRLLLSSLGAFVIFSLVASATSNSSTFTYTGFLVDNYCWDLPNHIGVDGTRLDVEPERHYLHCLLLTRPDCEDAYSFLEEYDNNGQRRFRLKYKLDTPSNVKAKQFFQSEIEKRDRRFDDMVTVTGSIDTDQAVIFNAEFQLASNTPSPSTSLDNSTSSPTNFLLPTIAPTPGEQNMSDSGGFQTFIGNNGSLGGWFAALIVLFILIYLIFLVSIFKPAGRKSTSPPKKV